MYKIFLDSIILKIDYDKDDKKLFYHQVLSYIKKLNYKLDSNIKQNILNKFNFMYLLRDDFGNNLLSSIKLSTKQSLTATDVVFIYALKSGIYLEINGLVQYKEDHRKEKFNLLHKIYKKFKGTISKVDIAIDFKCKMDDIKLFDKQLQPVSKSSKSTDNIHYFNVSNKQNRRLKLYYKSTQKFRSFPIAWDLSRLELTLKGDLIKEAQNIKTMTDRIKKEINNLNISVADKTLSIDPHEIVNFVENLFYTLDTGKQTKRYSNYSKNIDTSVKNMAIAWGSVQTNLTLQEYSKLNNISLTTLKTYRKYYRNYIL